jgi:hypothetical protein
MLIAKKHHAANNKVIPVRAQRCYYLLDAGGRFRSAATNTNRATQPRTLPMIAVIIILAALIVLVSTDCAGADCR